MKFVVAEGRPCGGCGGRLNAGGYAVCAVCAGLALCVQCARGHLCTERCRTSGCVPGLCVRMVRNGIVADRFGVPP